MSEQLEKIINIWNNKYSTNLRFSSRESDFTTNFPITLELDSKYNYELGLLWFSVYNTVFNINRNNNSFLLSAELRGSTKKIVIPPGAYELDILFKVIGELIKKEFNIDDVKNNPINFIINIPTSKIHLEIKKDYKIDFSSSDFGKFLGFTKQSYSLNTISENRINISNISSINIICDQIQGTYQNGKRDNCLYNFPYGTVRHGYRIVQQVSIPIYLPMISKYISSIHFKIVDQDNNLIDFNGEEITFSLHLKQV